MPLYEYRCRTCDETFELRRPMAEASDPAPCSAGHADSLRLLSVFASVGSSSSADGARSASTASPTMAPRGGCGSGCGCHH